MERERSKLRRCFNQGCSGAETGGQRHPHFLGKRYALLMILILRCSFSAKRPSTSLGALPIFILRTTSPVLTVACCLCSDMDSLPKPTFSDNLIYENRREVKYVVSRPIQQDFNSPSVTFQPITLTLKRGALVLRGWLNVMTPVVPTYASIVNCCPLLRQRSPLIYY